MIYYKGFYKLALLKVAVFTRLTVFTTVFITMLSMSPTVLFASPKNTPTVSTGFIITRFEPPLDAAIGLRLSPSRLETFMINETKVINHPFISLSFLLPAEGKNAVVGALLRSAGGKIEGTDMQPEWALRYDYGLPQCSEDLPSPTTLAGQLGMLQSLVEVRSGRARVAREIFLLRLTNFSKERIKKLENGFGLIGKYSQPIDEILDPYTIIDRVTRLVHAVRTYSLLKSARN